MEPAFPQFRDRQLQLSGRGFQRLGPGAVTAGEPLIGAFVTVGADLDGGFLVDQDLRRRLEQRPRHLGVIGSSTCLESP